MKKAKILTPWRQEIKKGLLINTPRLERDYRLLRWQDVTGQDAMKLPPDPNLLVLDVLVDDLTLQRIENDQNYFVLWSRNA